VPNLLTSSFQRVGVVGLIDLDTQLSLLVGLLIGPLQFHGSGIARGLFGRGVVGSIGARGLLGVGGRGGRVHHHVGAAERAGDVGAEPGVDALNVERVGALGEQPQELAVLELAEADGAVGGAEHAAGAVPRERDGLDRRVVEPDGPDVPHVVRDFFPGAVVGEGCGRRRGQGGFKKRLSPQPPAPHEDKYGEAEGEEGKHRDGDDEGGDEGAAAV
jgi:hypothetical protein